MKKTIYVFCCILLLGSCEQGERELTGTDTLKEAYEKEFLVGVAINPRISSGQDSATRSLVIRQFNTITAENALKAGPINPQPGVYNFGPADDLIEFGEKHDMFIVGHTLVWHNQTPAWFFMDENGNPNRPEDQIERMRNHIETVAGRYSGRIHAWDVVNEVIADDGSYRPTSWVESIGSGEDVLPQAGRFDTVGNGVAGHAERVLQRE